MKFLKNLFKNPFSKNKEEKKLLKEKTIKALIDLYTKEKEKPKQYIPKTNCKIQGYDLKIGDKIICRSNEPYPLLVGKIIEFWDNKGKWEQIVPVVRENRTGKKFNVHGIVRPYSKELLNTLSSMKPLEQWNYFVPEESRYTEEEMKRKVESFEKRKKFLPKKK